MNSRRCCTELMTSTVSLMSIDGSASELSRLATAMSTAASACIDILSNNSTIACPTARPLARGSLELFCFDILGLLVAEENRFEGDDAG